MSTENKIDRDVPPKRFLHVLLVEDNQVNQLVAIRSLAKTGHSVVIVTNGRDALKALKNGSDDLVFDGHPHAGDGRDRGDRNNS